MKFNIGKKNADLFPGIESSLTNRALETVNVENFVSGSTHEILFRQRAFTTSTTIAESPKVKNYHKKWQRKLEFQAMHER